MRRGRGTRRGRWLWVLAAGFIGYLLGDWRAATLRSANFSPSPSQNVALRFPEAKVETTVVGADLPTGTIGATGLKEAQLALFSAEPMVPVVHPQPAAATVPPSERVSAPPPSPPAPAPYAESRSETKSTVTTPAHAATKQSALESARHANRPGFLLNDAQIASIKRRLHLTPDQERMWPAVEAALRNIAYAKARDHRPGLPVEMLTASLDADSTEVQGLKSAAIPLIMSFNDEQKNEVRSLAHVMGLDKLAAEF
jgi:hypothetical protein